MLYHLFPLLALGLYIAASVLYLRNLFVSGSSELFVPRGMLTGGLLCHFLFFVVVLGWMPFIDEVPSLPAGFPLTLSLAAFVAVAAFLVLERRFQLGSLGVFVAPIALAAVLYSSVASHAESGSELPNGMNLILLGHIAASVLAHAVFFVSFGVSLALLCQKSLLKRRRFTRFQQLLPSLQFLDATNAFAILLGFAFMTLSVGLGLLYALAHEVTLVPRDPRLLWSFLILGVYASVVSARVLKGVRGGRAAWLSVMGFSLNVLSFFALQFFNTTFHAF